MVALPKSAVLPNSLYTLTIEQFLVCRSHYVFTVCVASEFEL